jgi:hypothetical protein
MMPRVRRRSAGQGTRRPGGRHTKARRSASDRLPPISEKQFMGQVVQLARLMGWMVYHTHISIHSQAGFPDLTFVRGDRLIFAELKRESGRTTPEQEHWLDALRQAGQEAYLWMPSDWSAIEATLAG